MKLPTMNQVDDIAFWTVAVLVVLTIAFTGAMVLGANDRLLRAYDHYSPALASTPSEAER